MSNDTPNLSLPYILAAQAQKHVTHNEAIRALDALVQLAVLDKDLAAPPGSPSDGQRWIVAASATAAWAGKTGKVAAHQDGAWVFLTPREGWIAWVVDEEALYAYNGTAWVVASSGGGGASLNPATGGLVGVNTTADTTNRLAVSSPATLFNHAGAGHQTKINKAAAAQTAAILFQTAFSGRAEMGTAGDDDFRFKVSADGSVWNDAIHIQRATGTVSFPSGLSMLPVTVNTFVESGTWTKPDGCRLIRVRAIGGGGGGGSAQGGSSQLAMSTGGAAGTFGETWMDTSALGSVIVTIGAGGSGGSDSTEESGASGGTTSFGAHLSCPGGGGGGTRAAGTSATSSPSSVEAAAATGATFHIRGGRGGEGIRFSGTAGFGGTGTPSVLSSGAPLNLNAPGRNAFGYGGGGGGTASSNTTVRAGGNGSPGIVVVEEFY